MRKVVLAAVAVAMLMILAPRLSRLVDRTRAVAVARDRVERMLGSMVAASGSATAPEARTAACLWFKGTLEILDRDELIAAEEGFRAWRTRRGLGGPVGAWRLESAALPDPHDLTTVFIAATVDGRTLGLTVTRGRTID